MRFALVHTSWLRAGKSAPFVDQGRQEGGGSQGRRGLASGKPATMREIKSAGKHGKEYHEGRATVYLKVYLMVDQLERLWKTRGGVVVDT